MSESAGTRDSRASLVCASVKLSCFSDSSCGGKMVLRRGGLRHPPGSVPGNAGIFTPRKGEGQESKKIGGSAGLTGKWGAGGVFSLSGQF